MTDLGKKVLQGRRMRMRRMRRRKMRTMIPLSPFLHLARILLMLLAYCFYDLGHVCCGRNVAR